MSCPDQLGALYFDKLDVSEFLGGWNIDYKDLSGPHRYDYCAPEIKDIIELLPRYDNNDWDTLHKAIGGEEREGRISYGIPVRYIWINAVGIGMEFE
jgi:hypothetical protein